MNVLNDQRPWVEKYRPTNFDDIVLDDMTREIFTQILKKQMMPNLLLYGPPGTGKTTTIINLVNEYRMRLNESGSGMIIHLNASDERGVDIVRGTLSNFTNSNNMFNKGTKFVILDEADYMTIPAQNALRQLIQKYHNIRFCLICNYVSKVETSLRNEFVRIRFNHLPVNLITNFLKKISNAENLDMSDSDIDDIRNMFGSDMRSMINFIQISNGVSNIKSSIISSVEWDNLFNECLCYISNIKLNKNEKNITRQLKQFSNRGFGIINIIREFTNYLVTRYLEYITAEFLTKIDFVIHNDMNDTNIIISYFINECITFLKENPTIS